MIKTETMEQIARELFDAEKNKTAVGKFVDRFPELDADSAYDVQDKLIEIKCNEENTSIIGRKLGLTSKAKQKMIGVHEPSYGVLLKNMQLYEGDPIPISPFIHAKVEPEIAFIFHKEVSGPTITTADIMEATAFIAPAFEIIDSRYKNFSFTLPDGIADNSSSSRFIIGERFYSPDEVDLRLMGLVFRKNGEVISTGAGAAVMGHPARAIAWMANKLYKRGQSIKPGEIVLSGAVTASETIHAGDRFSASFDGIGSIEAVFKE